jgi:hypothetical protein
MLKAYRLAELGALTPTLCVLLNGEQMSVVSGEVLFNRWAAPEVFPGIGENCFCNKISMFRPSPFLYTPFDPS